MALVRSWGFASLVLTTLIALVVALSAQWAIVHVSEQAGPTANGALLPAFATTDRLIQGLQSRLSAGLKEARSYSLLGDAYLQKARESGDPGYYNRAEAAFDKALTLDSLDFQAMAGMGALSLSRHEFGQALEWGQQGLKLNPHSAHIQSIIGDAFVGMGRYPEAWGAFQKAVDLRPDLSSYSRVSYARELTGDISGATQAMRRALDAGGPNVENTSWTRVQLGNLYFNSGDLARAETEYRTALELFPDYVHGMAGLARVAAAKGDYPQAIVMYEQVVDRMPLPEYVIALGDVYTAVGRPQDALRFYSLVEVQQQLYRANGVNTDLEMALFEADHNRDLDEALSMARQEYERRPSIWAADVLAWTLYKRGEYEEALSVGREALRLGTKDALMWFHAGMISYSLGQRDQAQDYLQSALSIKPYFSVIYRDEAQRTLEELRRTMLTHGT